MKKLPAWTRFPSTWILDRGLRQFRWNREGADGIAALITLAVIAHHIEPETGVARLTYDALSDMTSLSRAKVSAGLSLLVARDLIDRTPEGRSSYRLRDYNPRSGWAKLPAKGLYQNGVVSAFTEFRLRRPAELDAMKLYYLFAALRSRQTNMAKISYHRIEEYTAVPRNSIRRALTVLGANGLVHVERVTSDLSDYGVANAYRLAHLDPHIHMGTTGRGDLAVFGSLIQDE